MYLKQKAILAIGACSLCLLLPYVRPASPPRDTGPATVPSVRAAAAEPLHNTPASAAPSPAGLNNTAIPHARSIAVAPERPKHAETRLSHKSFQADGKTYPLRTYKPLLTPNDPNATQWWTTNTGLPVAWGYGIGTGAKIAVIDTGFALAHEEFADRWLTNSAEQGATVSQAGTGPNCTTRSLPLDKSCNGLDDDNNGYVDDVIGWDFYSDTPDVQAGKSNPTGLAASHGTGVTGVAAATGNNALGIAGVSWGAKILPLQAMSDDGVGDTLTIARAIMYATDRGVQVINLSLGSDQPDDYLRGAIRYALEHNVIMVAAAGNDGCDCIVYPARYPEVVAVGALTSAGTAAGFSSYGTALDLLAPGSGIRTTAWTAANQTSGYAASVAGTSFAAPYVSGLLANARIMQPNATWGELLHALLSQTDHQALTAAAPYSTTIGAGTVKADNYMKRLGDPYTEVSRSDLSLTDADSLDALTAKQCTTEFPTAPFYEIKLPAKTYYTISPLEASKQAAGTVTQKGYVCANLPTDTVSSVRHILNSPLEFSNVLSR